MGFDDTYERKSGLLNCFLAQTMENAVSCAVDMPQLSELITEETTLEKFESAIQSLMGIDSTSNDRKDIQAVKTMLVSDPNMI